MGSDYSERPEDRQRDEALAARLDQLAFQEMAANEEFLLTVSEDGFGKRSSSYEYRISGRGGQGVGAIDLTRTHGSSKVVAAFPLLPSDQIVMITDGGQLIRCTVDTVSIMSRKTRGVRLFNTAEGERVVSVTRIREVDDGSALGDETETGTDEGQQMDIDAQTADRPESDDEEGP
jgi:DNA gyrase subunit A